MNEKERKDAARICEIPGWYGPVYLEEKQIQRIWALGAFQREGLVTRSGKRLKIIQPGRWNFQEGPDFKEAILEINGQRVHGDVEIHLQEKDWHHHGHDSDENFSRVVLHVILFPSRSKDQRFDESKMETLEWLKYLQSDLQTCLDEIGLDELPETEWSDSLRAIGEIPVDSRWALLEEAARQRWERKVLTMKRRVETYGWEDTCHQTLLETLGLSRNRAALSRVAMAYPLSSWPMQDTAFPQRVVMEFHSEWHLAGIRPANKPVRRIADYSQWLQSRGKNWPNQLRQQRERLTRNSPRFQRLLIPHRITNRRQSTGLTKSNRWLQQFFQGLAGTSRIRTWIGDGFWPLMAAETNQDLFTTWFLGYPGDFPQRLRTLSQQLECTGPGKPACWGIDQAIIRILEPNYKNTLA